MSPTNPHRCPPLVGYILLNPLRQLMQNPKRLLSPYVHEGASVLEVGPAMGFFSLSLARMAGASGRLYAIDVQAYMIQKLKRRLERKGLAERCDCRVCPDDSLGIADLAGRIDFCLLAAVVHEVPDTAGFFREIAAAMKPGGKVLLTEPKGHVSEADFGRIVAVAADYGISGRGENRIVSFRTALLAKQTPTSP